ncbi:hypothetical protein OHB26_02140 [Nocardia sp. NBC_01503]|uniref:DUF7373 family lipoprotein n=1 Tax=Nocardia sp. NBC_01503 TaxID=2975997 RepID=UPI002E7C0ED5|nr:hypothetical protein [Nocardia sp. NBC_01503]WTL33078.1 hypothetical protein OHB26_02140 [Nocardia sp. NBC_01503]
MNEQARRALRRAATIAVSLTMLAGVLSGCGGEVVPGTPHAAQPALSGLDTGEVSTDQGAAPANDNDTYGRVLESVRLGEAVANPTDIDKDLVYGGSALLPTPGRTAVLAPEIALKPIAEFGMIAGYIVNGTDDPSGGVPKFGESKALRMTVLSFREDPIARLVAGRIADSAAALSPDTRRVDIPGFADAFAVSRVRSPVLITAVAHRSFVVVTYVADRIPDTAALAGRTAATLAAELPLLDQFQPTAPDKLSAMPFDGDGMLRRLLHPDPVKWPYPSVGPNGTPAETTWFTFAPGSGVVYGPRAVSHLFGRGPATGEPARDDVERAAFIGNWWLLRLPDEAHVTAMHTRVLAKTTANGDIPATAPEGVPGAACFRSKDATDNQRETRYHCYISDGRYWAVITAPDEKTVRQRAAAQYALLVKNR